VSAAPGHGSIELIEGRCTSCMICARECPSWCITIDSHTEPVPGLPPGTRERTQNVLDRFEIDWSLCMYCGICVEECPFDALAWEPEHTAAAPSTLTLRYGIAELSRK
jgi:NADH-quinone oxidoreductase subunit I